MSCRTQSTMLFRLFTSVRTSTSTGFVRIIHNGDRRCEHDKSTVASAARRWRQQFEKEGIPEPDESVQHIMSHVLGTTKRTDLLNLNEELNKEQLNRFELLCECRLSRMPVQYIIGDWDFRDITLKMEPPVFIPRPETEILVEYLLKRILDSKKDTCKVLEIGCGSGAICLSLLRSNEKLNLIAIDINSQACELTMRNARSLGLESHLIILNAMITENGQIDVKKGYSAKESVNFTEAKFDFIVSNPPYIPTKTIFKLEPEINLYEDINALDGGQDGLKVIKSILKYSSEALNIGGFLLLEIDSSHSTPIKSLIEEQYVKDLKIEQVHKDFCNNDRFIEILKIK